jgi:hypothetical protein
MPQKASQAYRACDQKPCNFGLHWQNNAHKIVHAQLIQHGKDKQQKEIGKRLGAELGY